MSKTLVQEIRASLQVAYEHKTAGQFKECESAFRNVKDCVKQLRHEASDSEHRPTWMFADVLVESIVALKREDLSHVVLSALDDVLDMYLSGRREQSDINVARVRLGRVGLLPQASLKRPSVSL